MGSTPHFTPADLEKHPHLRDLVSAQLGSTLPDISNIHKFDGPKWEGKEIGKGGFQAVAEGYLEACGYMKPPNTKSIGWEPPRVGWQFHMSYAQGNDRLLDILLLRNTGAWIQIELKVKGGKLSALQQEWIRRGCGRCFLAWNMDQVRQIVADEGNWELGSE